jgi:hypothetical protein
MSSPPAVPAASGAVEEVGVELIVPAHLAAIFEKADSELRAAYGVAPGAATLIRFWLSGATSKRVRKKFETAVLQLNDSVLAFEHGDECDGDDE